MSDELRLLITGELRVYLEGEGVDTTGSNEWLLRLWAGVAWESHLVTLIVDGSVLSFGWQSGKVVRNEFDVKKLSVGLRVGLEDPGCFERVRDFVRRGQDGELPPGYWDVARATNWAG